MIEVFIIALIVFVNFWGVMIFVRLGQIEKATWDVALKTFQAGLRR